MRPETMLPDHRFELTILDVVALLGPHSVSFKEVAHLMGTSKATLYRQFGSWNELMSYIHGEIIEAVDRLFACGESTRREEFEQWWAALSGFLRSPRGRAFRALRPC